MNTTIFLIPLDDKALWRQSDVSGGRARENCRKRPPYLLAKRLGNGRTTDTVIIKAREKELSGAVSSLPDAVPIRR